MSETTTAPVDNRIIVTPFGIEADHPRNCELLLTSIPNGRLRSAFDGMKPAIGRDGQPRVPLDQAATFSTFPRAPGMQLYVNPKTCEYKIIDPMHKNEKLCAQMGKALGGGQRKYDGAEPQHGTLDPHQMKTLCREMAFLVESGEAKICHGDLPSKEEIERLPGHFLLNPINRIGTTQPKYEKDFPGWVENLSHSGG